MKKIIENVDNLDVSSNEFSLSHTILRIINKLFENDEALKAFYNEVFGEFMIYEYEPGHTYEYNDLVWYLDKTPQEYNGKRYKNLHVLRCDVNKTSANLDKEWPAKSFAVLGWFDLNPNIDILQNYGLQKKIDLYINKMFKRHTDDKDMHKYGKVSYDEYSKNALSSKVALTDFSNLDKNREENFFPYETICLKHDENDAILNGYANWYDNGLLEYDIVFRLGYVGYYETDEEYHISSDVISCNTIDLSEYHVDDKYFNSASDMSIFKSYNAYQSEIGSTIQGNRNDYVNVYSATIDFAKAAGCGDANKALMMQFDDTNYMVFCSNVMSLSRNPKTEYLNPSPNLITFCNKSPGSITAILVTYPTKGNFSKKGYNASGSGLQANSFHCHIVGKGKKK